MLHFFGQFLPAPRLADGPGGRPDQAPFFSNQPEPRPVDWRLSAAERDAAYLRGDFVDGPRDRREAPPFASLMMPPYY